MRGKCMEEKSGPQSPVTSKKDQDSEKNVCAFTGGGGKMRERRAGLGEDLQTLPRPPLLDTDRAVREGDTDGH